MPLFRRPLARQSNELAGGRWNTFEIYAKGPQIMVKMNGVVTVSALDSNSLKGRIGIQFNQGPIKVRKLVVEEL